MELTRREALKAAATAAVVLSGVSAVGSRVAFQTGGPAVGEVVRPVVCGGCGAGCGMLFVKRGDSMYLLPNLKHPVPGSCFRGSSTIQLWNHPLRLKKPLKRVGERGEGKFVEVDWETALNEIAAKLREIVDKYGPHSVAFTRHAYMAWHLPFIAAVLGSPNAIGHEQTCHNGSTAGRKFVLGGGGPPTVDPDYENVRYVVIVGRGLDANISLVRRLNKSREKGAKVVLVDPRLPNLGYSAVEWIPIRPGSEPAFLLAIIHVLIKEGLYDAAFLKRYTNAPFLIKPDGHPLTDGRGRYLVYDAARGAPVPHDEAVDPSLDFEGDVEVGGGKIRVKTAFRLLAERAAKYPPEVAEKLSDIPAETIVRIARELYTQRGVVDDGWYAAKNGNEYHTYRAIVVINALLGNIDKIGGLCLKEDPQFPDPVVYTKEGAVTPMGTLPPIDKPAVDAVMYPEGVHTFDAVLDAILEEKPYPIKALFIVGTSPFHRDPYAEKLVKALRKLELVVTIDILPQDHVDWSDYVLPDEIYLERYDLIGPIPWTLHAAVQASAKVLDPPPGYDVRSAFWALMEIVRRAFPERARLVGYTEEYRDYGRFREYVDKFNRVLVESLAKRWGVEPGRIVEALERDGFYVFKYKEYESMPYKKPLNTPSGKVEIYTLRSLKYGLDPLPDYVPPVYTLPRGPDEFYLLVAKDNIISSHMVMVKNAKYIVDRSIWMNPADAERLGIKDGDMIELEAIDTGAKARAVVKVTNRIRPGVLFTYAFAGGRRSKLITEEYAFLREGVNIHWLNGKNRLEPVIGNYPTNCSVRVRKL